MALDQMIDAVTADRMDEDDFIDLMRAAERALRQALGDGERKGFQAGDWLKQSVAHHLEHAENHIRALTSNTSSAISREELSHAICRLVMTWAKREEGCGK